MIRNMKIYSGQSLMTDDAKELEENDKEIRDSPFTDINISTIKKPDENPNYSLSSSINSSLNASMNFSSFLALNESIKTEKQQEIEKVSKVWNNLNSVRNEYLFDIKNKMNQFQNALSLWNEGGFIPLFTNFMSWINEANLEINNLSQRLTNSTFLFQRFVKLYKKQQFTLKQKEKVNKDLQFENNELIKENEYLRKQLLDLTSTISTSHQNLKYLENKENISRKNFIKELEKIENAENDDDEFHKMGNVTIFKLETDEKAKSVKLSKKTKKLRISNRSSNLNQNRSKKKNEDNNKNDNGSKKKKLNLTQNRSRKKNENTNKKGSKKKKSLTITRSRSHRYSRTKLITPRSKSLNKNKRRNSEPRAIQNISNLNDIQQNKNYSKNKENKIDFKTKMNNKNVSNLKMPRISRASSIPKPKSRKSLSTLRNLNNNGNLSAVRKPTATLRRLSYSRAEVNIS